MAYEKEREQAKGLIDAFAALPYPGPMLAQMLEQGHFHLRQVSFDEMYEFAPHQRRRVITIEIEQFIFMGPKAKPKPPYDFESTAEEIVDPTELPAPPRQLPRGD